MIETSPRLTGMQKTDARGQSVRLDWHETIDTLPKAPLLIVGNELFDAVPIRQYVRAGAGWRERMVGLDDGGRTLRFVAGAGSLDPLCCRMKPPMRRKELSSRWRRPARALMAAIAERIAGQGGAGLFIDYGHLEPGVGDTLQALAQASITTDVLANPGEADLTAHVDFSALAAAVRVAGPRCADRRRRANSCSAWALSSAPAGLAANADEAGASRPYPAPSSAWPGRTRWAGCSKCWQSWPENECCP